ncbi:protein unc-80 homolog [Gordionus sp. m RMFG-2023]|uniref:protein unc-80 homolog n=1 Tax=Gordionus sp. m RMFG-2023 TaxID=3053472 RepID=UPI0031FD0B81
MNNDFNIKSFANEFWTQKNSEIVEKVKFDPNNTFEFKTMLEILIKTLKYVGCLYGCKFESNLQLSEEVSKIDKSCLMMLYSLNPTKYIRFFKSLSIKDKMSNQIEFYHVLLGFCLDKKTNENMNASSRPVVSHSCDSIEYITLDCAFENFIHKLGKNSKTLMNPENFNLFTDILKFVNFVKDEYENIFSRIALSGFVTSGQNINQLLTKFTMIPLMQFNGDFRKESHIRSQSFEEDLDAIKNFSSEDLASKYGKNGRPKQIKNRIKRVVDKYKMKNKSVKQPKGKTIESLIRASELQKITAFHHFAFPNVKKHNVTSNNTDTSDDISRTSMPTFKIKNYLIPEKYRSEIKFKQAMMTSNIANDFDSRPNESKHQISKKDVKMQVDYLKLYVEVDKLKRGLLCMHTLFQSTHIGTFPESGMIASMLDLECPMLHRACFIVECCHYVHTCNMGRILNCFKNESLFMASPMPNKKTFKKLNHTKILLGNLFYKWGEVIGIKLENLMKKEAYLNNGKGTTNKNDDFQIGYLNVEDFFMENVDMGKKNEYNILIKFLMTNLLYEITVYLKSLRKRNSSSKGKTIKKYGVSWEKKKRSRWNSLLGLMGVSISSLSSGGPDISEPRKSLLASNLSQKEDSSQGSITSVHLDDTITEEDIPQDQSNKKLSEGYIYENKIRRRFGSSFGSFAGHNKSRRSSLKFKRGEDMSRKDSLKSSRKLSSVDQSVPSSTNGTRAVNKTESHNVTPSRDKESSIDASDDQIDSSNVIISIPETYPWIVISLGMQTMLDYECKHSPSCSPYCYKLLYENMNQLLKAVSLVYEYDIKKDKICDVHSLNTLQYLMKKKALVHHPPILIENTPDHQSSKYIDKYHSKLSTIIPNYIQNQVKDCSHSIFTMLVKIAPLIPEHLFQIGMNCAWSLVKSSNKYLSYSSAAFITLGSIKFPDFTITLIKNGFDSKDENEIIKSILKFYRLWKYRNYIWPQIYDESTSTFKISPPNIEFTLPSPMLGTSFPEIFNAPWNLIVRSSFEDLTLSQDISTVMITTAKSRKKQKELFIERLKQSQKDNLKKNRENCQITAIAYLQQASFDQLINRSGLEQDDENEDKFDMVTTVNCKISNTIFPSSLSSIFIKLLTFLHDEDLHFNVASIKIKKLCTFILWNCMCEDPLYFMRSIFERLTKKEMPFLINWVQTLLNQFSQLPPYFAYIIFNYMLGYCMYCIRFSKQPEAQILSCSILWQLCPFVNGISIKDLSQTLRREQCDMALSILAFNPPTKKIIVHAPDLTSIPTQLSVTELTKFKDVLQESLEFFNIQKVEYLNYQLINTKTKRMHNPNSFVRDYYIFKKSIYPQLSLLRIDPSSADIIIEKEELLTIVNEINRIQLVMIFLNYSRKDSLQNTTYYLCEELKKNPIFLRKALNSNCTLYGNGLLGKENMSFDILQSYSWIKLIDSIFYSGNTLLSTLEEFQTFIPALMGIILLYNENFAIMRCGLASLINFPLSYKHVFGNYGYILLVPMLLRIYAYGIKNLHTKNTVENLFKVYYTMHRKPFVLQVLACISQIMEENEMNDKSYYVDPMIMYDLIFSMEKNFNIDLSSILELLQNGQSSIECLDICYTNDSDGLNFIEIISMCITVISYNSESGRSLQMLIILRDVIPYYHKYLVNKSKQNSNDKKIIAEELSAYKTIYTDIQTLLRNVESFSRPFVGHMPRENDRKLFHNRNIFGHFRDKEKFSENWKKQTFNNVMKSEKFDQKYLLQQYDNYTKPRDLLLSFVSDFLYINQCRISELIQLGLVDKQNFNKSNFQLDQHSNTKIAEIVNALLRLVPYDIQTLTRYGINSYLTKVMPTIDWSLDISRPSLNIIYKRLDKMLLKINKNTNSNKNYYELDYLTVPIRSIIGTMKKYPFIAHLPTIKSITQTCINMVHQYTFSCTPYDKVEDVFDLNGDSFMSLTLDLAIEHMSILRENFINLGNIPNSMANTLSHKFDSYLFFFYTPLLLYYIKCESSLDLDEHIFSNILNAIVRILSLDNFQNFYKENHQGSVSHDRQNLSSQGAYYNNNNSNINKSGGYTINTSDEASSLDGETLCHVCLWSLKVAILFNENLTHNYTFKLYKILSMLVVIYKNTAMMRDFEKFIYSYRPNLYLTYRYIKKTSIDARKSSAPDIDGFRESMFKKFVTKKEIIRDLIEEYSHLKILVNERIHDKKMRNHNLSSILIDPIYDSPSSVVNSKSIKMEDQTNPSGSKESLDPNEDNKDATGCKRYGPGRKTLRMTKKKSSLKHEQAFYIEGNAPTSMYMFTKPEILKESEINSKDNVQSLLNPSLNETISSESVASETSALLGQDKAHLTERMKLDTNLYDKYNDQNV